MSSPDSSSSSGRPLFGTDSKIYILTDSGYEEFSSDNYKYNSTRITFTKENQKLKGSELKFKITNLKFSQTSPSNKNFVLINASDVALNTSSDVKDAYLLESQELVCNGTSKGLYFSQTFVNCTKLTTIPHLNTSNATQMDSMFRGCNRLISIPNLDTSKVTDMRQMFSNCKALEEIHMTGMKANFKISASTKFTREALLEILNNLATVTTTRTLTMGSTNLAKLTDEDKAIATNKGWTLA